MHQSGVYGGLARGRLEKYTKLGALRMVLNCELRPLQFLSYWLQRRILKIDFSLNHICQIVSSCVCSR